jgi:hypothetical protein
MAQQAMIVANSVPTFKISKNTKSWGLLDWTPQVQNKLVQNLQK